MFPFSNISYVYYDHVLEFSRCSITIFSTFFSALVQNYKPSLVVLMEPRISGYKADNFIKRNGFDKSYRVEGERFSGGFWVLWKDLFQVEIVASHSQFVNLQISNSNNVLS